MNDYIEEVIAAFRKVPGYPVDEKRDRAWLAELVSDEGFTLDKIDLVEEVRSWKAYILDKPFDKKSKPRAQFRTWIKNSLAWGRARPRKVEAQTLSLSVADQLRLQREKREAELAARGIRFEN